MIEEKIVIEQEKNACRIERECQMIRVLICDDDALFADHLCAKIQELLGKLGVKSKIHVYNNFEDIGAPILSSCDMAFLDIDFPRKRYTGIDVARRLRVVREDAVITFITNFLEYAPEGYELRAFRYILKSQLDEKLEECLRLGLSHFQSSQEMMKIQINGELIDILISEILYFESRQHMVIVYVQKGMQGKRLKEYSFYASLSSIEKQLEQNGFLRIHKSFLVNMDYIKKYQCNEAVLSNGTVLRVSEKNYSQQKKKYMLWKGR